MKNIRFDQIKNYRDDAEFGKRYLGSIRSRFWLSILFIMLAFICFFLTFYLNESLLPVLAMIASLGAFFYFQKLPKIKCMACSCHYTYLNVTEGSDVIIYGVCHKCKIKMNIRVPLTSG